MRLLRGIHDFGRGFAARQHFLVLSSAVCDSIFNGTNDYHCEQKCAEAICDVACSREHRRAYTQVWFLNFRFRTAGIQIDGPPDR